MVPNYEEFVQQLSQTQKWKELSDERKLAQRRRVYGWLIGFAIFLFGCCLILFGTDSDTIFSGFGALVVSVFFVIFMYRLTHKTYSKLYKKLIVPQLVSDIIEQAAASDDSANQASRCSFKHSAHINFNLLTKIPLFQKYDHERISYEGEDLFRGTLMKTDFQFSDFVIKRNRDIPLANQDVDITVFKGLVFIADFHKSFTGTTTITTRRGKIYGHQTIIGSRMKTISHDFDRLFKVRTTDELTAQYLLPVNMLERIMNLRKLFPGKGMAVCLHDGMVVISIHKVDFFESDGLKKLENQGVQRTYEEIKAIVEIIEVLNLNLRIWGKRGKDFVSSKTR